MKQLALKENHLYAKAYSKGKRISAHNVTVNLLKDTHAWIIKKQNPQKKLLNRVGLTASKKIGGAVERNRAKRVMREAYRLIDGNCGVKKGNIIVIVAKESATKVKMQDIYDDLLFAFGKLDLLEKND